MYTKDSEVHYLKYMKNLNGKNSKLLLKTGRNGKKWKIYNVHE